ncbi:MAG: branched-chain amino acid ABC transporter permease [Proteobacteria bacterium]|nr:branched-chain amino acid ABC transporter permease [Pseudomonadota bacterium]
MLGFSRTQSVALAVLVLVVIAAPFLLYPIVVMQVMCYAIFAMGTNLLMGSVGLLSLGQAAYFGLGGYVAGYLVQSVGLTPELGIIAGGAAGALLGTGFGWLAIRRQDIYFAMVTLALAQIVYFAAVQATGFTGGENGIQGIARGDLFGHLPLKSDHAMYVVVAVIFLAGVVFVHRIVNSPFGQVVKAVRDNEPRMISLGYRTDAYKGMIFVLAALFAGVAGATKAMVMGIVTLSDVGATTSGLVVLMVLLGGIGTIFGPIVGAAIVVAMQYYLAPFGAWVIVIQGAIFMVCVLVFRRGIIGEVAFRLRTPL